MGHENWKFVFCEQRASGDLNIREAPFTSMRLSKIYSPPHGPATGQVA
jgi:hypothetical protein